MTDLKIGQRSVPVTTMEHHVAEEATEALQNVLCLFRLAALEPQEQVGPLRVRRPAP